MIADPAPAKRGRRYDAETVQYLEESEIEALFSVISDPRDRAIWEVALHRGLRASEVGLLLRSDLRLQARRLHVRRLKNGHSGDYVLTDREVGALKRWVLVRGDEGGPLFPRKRQPARPIRRQQLHCLMQSYGAAAGLPEAKRHFHVLRHTCGTVMSELAELIEVQDHLDHRDIRSTMRYAKVRSRRRDLLGERLAGKW
jgi:integrase